MSVIHYATGEAAQVGDRVDYNGWQSVVEDVIDNNARQVFWGLSEPGLMLKCDEAGLVFEPCSSSSWEAVVFLSRSPAT
jgi:hypothetical protein